MASLMTSPGTGLHLRLHVYSEMVFIDRPSCCLFLIVCVRAHQCVSIYCQGRTEEGVGYPGGGVNSGCELMVWALGAKLGSSVRAVQALHC